MGAGGNRRVSHSMENGNRISTSRRSTVATGVEHKSMVEQLRVIGSVPGTGFVFCGPVFRSRLGLPFLNSPPTTSENTTFCSFSIQVSHDTIQ
jgi:hypothetical protein